LLKVKKGFYAKDSEQEEEHTMSIDLKQNIKEMGQKLAELKDYL